MDFMQKFEHLNEGLKALNEAQVVDLHTHLEITVDDSRWMDLVRSSVVCSNLSMQAGKPVHFVTRRGANSTWWTNGVNYNPFGPSFEVRDESAHIVQYTDKTGYPHRVDGPANIRRYASGNYYEDYQIGPGVIHRVDGPAVTNLVAEDPHLVRWKDAMSSGNTAGYWALFPNDEMVRVFKSSTQSWVQHGRPKRDDDGYDQIYEENIYVGTLVTPTLIPKITKYCRKRVYRWRNEAGELDRCDGPAEVVLYGVVQVDVGAEKQSFKWDSWQSQWYTNGRSIPKDELDVWIAKHGIKIRKGPPIEHGSFERPDDEFCYLSDFLGMYARDAKF